MELSKNAQIILERRYLKKDSTGRIIETPEDMFCRVASVVAAAEKKYASPEVAAVWEAKFKKLMTNLEFLPNSPTLLNAGRELGMMSSCFVLPVKDSIQDIYRVLAEAALIHKHGGGTAFSFASIRPEGDRVADLQGVASGPVKLIKAFSEAINYIRQAGVRCGCNSACLPTDHPDILKFIEAKNDANVAPNFATSVTVSDDFIRKVTTGEDYNLINPRTGAITGRLNAKEVLLKIAGSAWQTGDPAITFIDHINESNTTPQLGSFETTDPCGGQLLLPYESSTLGTINLTRMLDCENGSYRIDYPRLAEVVHVAVRFLDDVLDANEYPVPAVAEASLRTRKIGLGIMGFAEMLIKLGIRYDSEQAVEVADELMGFIRNEAYSTSTRLAEERGAFPAYEGSTFEHNGGPPMRNASCLTLTNTGTTSLIANTTCGIHPVFSLVMVRNILDGTRLLDINRHFNEIARKADFFSRQLVTKLLSGISLKDCDDVPEEYRRLFVTTADIGPDWCIRIQAAFQKHTDNAISQTVNFPEEATKEDISELFLKVHELGLKGAAIYRDGSRDTQVLCTGSTCLDLVDKHFGESD